MNTYEHGKRECTFSFNFPNNPPMKKYEYKTLKYSLPWGGGKPAEMDDFIEPWARAGWRIVSSVAADVNGSDILIFLERERQS